MADPLAPNVHGCPDVELDLAHLERRRVAVPEEVADQGAVLGGLLGAVAVGDPGGLDDGGVASHVVDDADEPVMEHGEGTAEDFVQGWNGDAGFHGSAAYRGMGQSVGEKTLASPMRR